MNQVMEFEDLCQVVSSLTATFIDVTMRLSRRL